MKCLAEARPSYRTKVVGYKSKLTKQQRVAHVRFPLESSHFLHPGVRPPSADLLQKSGRPLWRMRFRVQPCYELEIYSVDGALDATQAMTEFCNKICQ